MDATGFEVRKEELLDECEVARQVFNHVVPRLERFMKPFVDSLVRRERIGHAGTFVQGLRSDPEHKNAESIAYRFGQERMPLQWFLGVSPWDDKPPRDELVRQVDAGDYRSPDSRGHLASAAKLLQMRYSITTAEGMRKTPATQHACPPLSLETV